MADLVTNRKARFNYHIIEKYEAGIELRGTEVKSCRANQISIQEGYITIEGGEAFLVGVHIAPYEQGNRENHEPLRRRRLLLHKKEIRKLKISIDAKGMTLVPLNFYLKKGKIKVGLGLGKGKDVSDKRNTSKERQDQIDIKRSMKI